MSVLNRLDSRFCFPPIDTCVNALLISGPGGNSSTIGPQDTSDDRLARVPEFG